MSQERASSLQDTFLRHVQERAIPVTVFLINGVRLQGYITGFDRFGVTLTRDRQSQFLFKRAISSVDPASDIQLLGDAEPEGLG